MTVNKKACEETKIANELMQLIQDQPDGALIKLSKLIRAKFAVPDPKEINYSNPAKDKPMNDLQAKKFEKEEMPFGESKGLQVYEVDPTYLIWLSEENKFTKDLKRYVKSEHFKKFRNR